MDLLKMKTSVRLMTAAAAVGVLALGATQAPAAGVNGGNVNGAVGVEVQNAITIVETTPIDFGKVVVIVDGTGTPATLNAQMSSAGVVTWPNVLGTGILGDEYGPVGIARMFPVDTTAQTGGVYAISGAAFFSEVGIVYNGGVVGNDGPPIDICMGACGADPKFTMDEFDTHDNTTAGILLTDGTGAVTLNVGGTLHADNAAPDNRNVNGSAAPIVGAYREGVYTGTLPIAVIY